MPAEKSKKRASNEDRNKEAKKKQSSSTIERPAYLTKVSFLLCFTYGSYILLPDKGFPEEGKAHDCKVEQGDRRVCNKQHKIAMIVVTNAVVNPWALVTICERW